MQFQEWVDLFESVELPINDAALTRALELRSRFDAALVAALGTFDGTQMWDMDGSSSMTAWLRSRGMVAPDAGWFASAAKRLRSLPVLRAAWSEGRLGEGQVKAILANIHNRRVDVFADQEADLVPALVGLSVADTQAAMNAWKTYAEALDDHDLPAMPTREAYMSKTLDGRWEQRGSYDAEGGAVIDAALQLVMDTESEEEWSLSAPQRRANAFVNVCRHFLDNQNLTKPGRRNRPHLNVSIESITHEGVTGELAEYQLPFDSPTLSRLLCDCDLHRVVRDQVGALLDYGTGSQTIPANLWRALVARDQHCRHPGCDRPARWCEGHHVQWFSNRGPTRLDNLVMMCSYHHHKLHLKGWDAKLKPDGELVITNPNGRVTSTYPPVPSGAPPTRKRDAA